jgi:hypothetical protein
LLTLLWFRWGSQDADALDLELDDVSFLQPAIELEARPARRGPRPEDLAGAERLAARDVGDHVRERMVHAPGVSLPQSSPLTRTSMRAEARSTSSGVAMQGPSTFAPSQSFAFPGPMPIGSGAQIAELERRLGAPR